MNIERGAKRAALVLLAVWVGGFVYVFGSGWHVIFFPAGSPGESCNAHFGFSPTPLGEPIPPDYYNDAASWAIYCNMMTKGDYSLFARIMFQNAVSQLAVLVAVPFAAWLLYLTARWVFRGFQST
jgi:hypothetical protein